MGGCRTNFSNDAMTKAKQNLGPRQNVRIVGREFPEGWEPCEAVASASHRLVSLTRSKLSSLGERLLFPPTGST